MTRESLKGLEKMLTQLKVSDLMVKPAITINVNDDFSNVEVTFVNKNIHSLPVVDNDRKFIGMITQQKLYKTVSPRKFPDGQVRYAPGRIIDGDSYYDKDDLNSYILNRLIEKDHPTVRENVCLGEAIKLIVGKKLRSLPVVDENRKVIGIISRLEFLRLASNVYEDYLKDKK